MNWKNPQAKFDLGLITVRATTKVVQQSGVRASSVKSG